MLPPSGSGGVAESTTLSRPIGAAGGAPLDNAPLLSLFPGTEPESTLALTPRRLVQGLSVEVVLYSLVFAAALLMRLIGLGARPLAGHEAAGALAAWQFVQGQGSSQIGSPLLMTSNLIGFFLGADSDLTPRLIPALVGSLGVLLPVLLRREIGRLAAFVASLLLLTSTCLVFFARDANGVEISAIAGVAAFIWLWRWVKDRRSRDQYAAALAGAVSLSASSAGFTILLAGVIWLAVNRFFSSRSGLREDREWSGPETAVVPENDGAAGAGSQGRNAIILFIAAYLALATAFLMNREGLGGAFNLLGDWLGQFSAIGPFTSPLNLLLIYEPVVLVFGLAGLFLVPGLVEGDRRTRGLLSFFAILSVFAFVVYSLAGVKTAADMVVIAVPLSLLAGWFLANLFERTVKEIERLGGLRTALWGELPLLVVTLALAAFVYLQLVGYLTSNRLSVLLDPFLRLFIAPPAGLSFDLALAVILGFVVLITVLLVLAAIGSVGTSRTANLAATVVAVLLLVGGLRSLWLANYSSPGPVHELLAADQTSLQARDLVSALEWQSQWRASDQHVISGRGDVSLGPVARWYLRGFPNLSWDQAPKPELTALVTPVNSAAPAGAWMSTDFEIGMNWRLAQLSRADLFRWLLLRQGGTEDRQTVRLWVPQPE